MIVSTKAPTMLVYPDDLKICYQLQRGMRGTHSSPIRTRMYSIILILVFSPWSTLVSACFRPPRPSPRPVDCKWGTWTWQSCDRTCGGGTQIGSRIIVQHASNGGRECIGSSRTTRACNTATCPGFTIFGYYLR